MTMNEVLYALETLGGQATTAQITKFLQEKFNHSGYICHTLKRLHKNKDIDHILGEKQMGGRPYIWRLVK